MEHQWNSDKLHAVVSVALNISSSEQKEMTMVRWSGKASSNGEGKTEEGTLNATETAVCNLSEFYWCSKR